MARSFSWLGRAAFTLLYDELSANRAGDDFPLGLVSRVGRDILPAKRPEHPDAGMYVGALTGMHNAATIAPIDRLAVDGAKVAGSGSDHSRGSIELSISSPGIRRMWLPVIETASKPSGRSGGVFSSLGLQAGQGMPAPPQVQACSPSHGLAGWFSQTQRQLSQRAHHFISEVPLRRRTLHSADFGRWLRARGF
ncbi:MULTISPECIES: hypothetical protein [Bradyrhizobium]|uniref:hypothetical protein n=1 Tax=Bradyrhizobium elkanii TaxID=29448 RepID=UPI0012BC5137|nr:hypothetical protein [Bradyrhizobium elkanii]